MRFFSTILLIFSFIFITFSSFNNPKCKGWRYYCGSDNQPLVCVNVTDSRQKVHLLQICPSGFYCPFNTNQGQSTIQCLPSPSPNKTYPGEHCQNNASCITSYCLNNICKGGLAEDPCKGNEYCDPGLYCNVNGSCSAQKAFGENCSDSYECTNNCACTLGQCAYYYSLSNGIASNNTETCASGYIVNNTCAESRRSMFAGSPCSSDTDCALLNSLGAVVGYSECSCGYNGAAFSYCALSEGDDEFINVINTFQYILLRSYNCHTLLRFGPCKYIYNDEYMDYHRALMKYSMSPQLVFNDDCIKKIYTSDYWNLYNMKFSFSFMLMLMILISHILIF